MKRDVQFVHERERILHGSILAASVLRCATLPHARR
jgi:hypothetical protein